MLRLSCNTYPAHPTATPGVLPPVENTAPFLHNTFQLMHTLHVFALIMLLLPPLLGAVNPKFLDAGARSGLGIDDLLKRGSCWCEPPVDRPDEKRQGSVCLVHTVCRPDPRPPNPNLNPILTLTSTQS